VKRPVWLDRYVITMTVVFVWGTVSLILMVVNHV
jgi:hypothetical protein